MIQMSPKVGVSQTEHGAGSLRTVFASGKDFREPGQALHTNFKLNTSGEFLGLFDADGVLQSGFEPNTPSKWLESPTASLTAGRFIMRRSLNFAIGFQPTILWMLLGSDSVLMTEPGLWDRVEWALMAPEGRPCNRWC